MQGVIGSLYTDRLRSLIQNLRAIGARVGGRERESWLGQTMENSKVPQSVVTNFVLYRVFYFVDVQVINIPILRPMVR